jgi:glycosyltransferase involved in cell wall biosynthesis
VKKIKTDIVIAVDISSLFVCQDYFDHCEFLSLEIYPGDPYKRKIKTDKIRSVFIQNIERFNYLFGTTALKTFLIQNAPSFKDEYITHYDRKGLVWAGSIVKKFAVLDCIAFIEKYPQYELTLKGGSERKTLIHIKERYLALLQNGHLKINQDYLDNDQFIDYLSHFRIGFCFYSWDLINSSINYQTAPSGKLFMCLAAGVPVIASNIPGFQFIREFNAGVLVNDYLPETIKAAIDEIELNYEQYRQAGYLAAKTYSFKESVKPYIDYLLTL